MIEKRFVSLSSVYGFRKKRKEESYGTIQEKESFPLVARRGKTNEASSLKGGNAQKEGQMTSMNLFCWDLRLAWLRSTESHVGCISCSS